MTLIFYKRFIRSFGHVRDTHFIALISAEKNGKWRSLDADVPGCFQHKYDYIHVATCSIKLSFREYLGHDMFSRSASSLQSIQIIMRFKIDYHIMG